MMEYNSSNFPPEKKRDDRIQSKKNETDQYKRIHSLAGKSKQTNKQSTENRSFHLAYSQFMNWCCSFQYCSNT